MWHSLRYSGVFGASGVLVKAITCFFACFDQLATSVGIFPFSVQPKCATLICIYIKWVVVFNYLYIGYDDILLYCTVKAGGMRVARTHQSSTGESKEKNEMTKEEIEEYGTRWVELLFLEIYRKPDSPKVWNCKIDWISQNNFPPSIQILKTCVE